MSQFGPLETFVRVVETGSFSAAARDLRVGQPAVSKAVAALEERFGVRLLNRTTRRLTPTEAGLAFYEHARRAVDEAAEAESAARAAGRSFVGKLRFSAPVTLARLHIVPRLGEFLAEHPDLSIDAVLDDRAVDPVAERIDVAFRLGALTDSSLVAKRIASGRRGVFASRAYLSGRAAPSTPTDLLSHACVAYAQPAGGEEWRFRRGTSETSVRVKPRVSATAAEGVREAVKAGLGLALGSEWMFAPELLSGEVESVLQDWTIADIDLWAVFPSGRLPAAKARAFADFVAAKVSGAVDRPQDAAKGARARRTRRRG